jgi:hypothetical protein
MSVNKYGPVIRAIAAFYGRPGGADGSGVDRAHPPRIRPRCAPGTLDVFGEGKFPYHFPYGEMIR